VKRVLRAPSAAERPKFPRSPCRRLVRIASWRNYTASVQDGRPAENLWRVCPPALRLRIERVQALTRPRGTPSTPLTNLALSGICSYSFRVSSPAPPPGSRFRRRHRCLSHAIDRRARSGRRFLRRANRRHPDERIRRQQHRCERPARVVGISPATRHATRDQPLGVAPPPRRWGHAYCRRRCHGGRGRRVPLVRRLRMGSLLPGHCGAESRRWLLVPHYRSLRIRPNLSLVRRPPGRRCW